MPYGESWGVFRDGNTLPSVVLASRRQAVVKATLEGEVWEAIEQKKTPNV